MERSRHIGRYRLLDRIGEGGMGVVWRAVADDGRLLAIKTLRVDRPDLRRALAREVAGLAGLDHPGIAGLVDHGEHDGNPWVATPWVEGRPLRLRRSIARTFAADDPGAVPPEEPAGPPPGELGELATTFHRICAVLAWLHGEGIVHRDLKPENFVVRPDGWPVLLDFGLAGRFAGGRTREEARDGIVRAGTVGLMAPEQRAGGLVDARADLYALGAMLFLALTGAVPAVPPRGGAAGIGPRPSERVEDVPPALDEVVARLLAPRPEDRPGHALDVALVLEACGADPTPWPEAPPTRWYVYRPRLAGRDAELAAIGALVTGLADGRGGVHLFSGEAGAGRSRIVLEAAALAHAAGVRPIVVAPGPVPTLGPALAELSGKVEVDEGVAEAVPTVAAILTGVTIALGDEQRGSPQAAPPTVEGLLAWLGQAALGRPLLLAIDDLDAADETTQRLVARIAAGRPPRIGVVASARGADRLPLELTALARALPPLDGPAVARIVGDLLAESEVDADGAARLAARTRGRPLLLVEAVRTGVELGLLRRIRGRWRMSRPVDELVPDDEQDLLADLFLRRSTLLAPAQREVLAVAAVVGDRVDAELLHALLPDAPVEAGLAAGLRDGSLDEVAGGLRFVHAHVRAALASTLPADRRTALHRRIADHLATSAAELDALAEHLEGAGALEEARAVWVRHGLVLRDRRLPHAAAGAFRRALRLRGADPMHDVRMELVVQLIEASRLAEAVPVAEELIAEGGASSVVTRAGRARAYALMHVDPTAGLQAAYEAVELARRGGRPEDIAAAWSLVAHNCAGAGRYRDARTAIDEALAISPTGGVARTTLLIHLGGVLTYERRRRDAQACFEEGLRDPTVSPIHRAILLGNLGIVLVWGGELARATEVLSAAGELYRAEGDLDGSLRVELDLASVDRLKDRLEAAELRTGWVVEIARRAALAPMLADALQRRAEVALARGDLALSRACLGELRDSKVPAAPARLVEVRLLRRAGDLRGAGDVLAATPLAEAFGDALPLLAIEALLLAWAEGRDGRAEQRALDEVLASFPDPIHPEGFVGRALARVERARAAREAGRPLTCGEHPDDVPAALD